MFTANAKETTEGGRVPKSSFWNNTPSLLLTFAVRAPPLGLPPVLPLLNSEKLVLEQHSFTFADFCCPRLPPWGCRRLGAAAALGPGPALEPWLGPGPPWT